MSEGTNLALPDRAEVKELAVRIEQMLPGSKELPPGGRLALAQVAVSMRLNPFTGEVWAIPKKQNGVVVGWDIMVGIKGLRRGARKTGTPYSITFRNMNSDEAAEWGLQKGDIGKVAMLYRLSDGDREVYKITGQWPVIEGPGICRSGEQTKMAHPLVAKKRAEAEALKVAYDMPLTFDDAADEVTPEVPGSLEDLFEPKASKGDVVEGEFRESGTPAEPSIDAPEAPPESEAPATIEPQKPAKANGNAKSGSLPPRAEMLDRINTRLLEGQELTGGKRWNPFHLSKHLSKHYHGSNNLSTLTDAELMAFGMALKQELNGISKGESFEDETEPEPQPAQLI